MCLEEERVYSGANTHACSASCRPPLSYHIASRTSRRAAAARHALQHRTHLGCALLARALALGGRAALDGGRALLQRGQLGAARAQRRLQPGEAAAGSVSPGARALALCISTCPRPGSHCGKASRITLSGELPAWELTACAQQHAFPAWILIKPVQVGGEDRAGNPNPILHVVFLHTDGRALCGRAGLLRGRQRGVPLGVARSRQLRPRGGRGRRRRVRSSSALRGLCHIGALRRRRRCGLRCVRAGCLCTVTDDNKCPSCVASLPPLRAARCA